MFKTRRKKLIIILASIVLVLGMFIVLGRYFLDPYRGTCYNYKKDSLPLEKVIERDKAVDDIKFAVHMIKTRHYSSIHGLPANVKAQYLEEIKNLSDKPTTVDVWRAVARILKQLKDGHSQVKTVYKNSSYVDAIFQVERGITYIKLGDQLFKVNKINGTSIQDIYKNAQSLFSYENIYYLDAQFERRICSYETLTFLGVEPKKEYTVEYSIDGGTQTITYPYKKYEQYTGAVQEQTDFIKYNIDAKHKVAILTIDSCINNDLYKKTLKAFFQEVKQSQINNIAVDLRNNGGGDSSVANEFIKYLNVTSYKEFGCKVRYGLLHINSKVSICKNEQYKDLLFNGNVYVLTSPVTFSSAMMFSVYLQDNKLAKVIGEPSGNSPSAYGDVISFQLPNTKLAFRTTYKYFCRPDESKASEEAQVPDYLVRSEDAVTELYQVLNIEQ